MKAVVWHGRRDVRVDEVPDPKIQEPTDAIVRVTSSGICGSDLHLYEVLGPFLCEGDILGHEPIGIVEDVGLGVTTIAPGDRVVVPFGIACGTCFMCQRGLQSQCETTQVRREGTGAALLGYTRLYGQVPGGQAEYLRVPQAHYGPIKVPDGPSDDRFVYLSDVLPTAWQAVKYAGIAPGDTLAVLGLGPVGDMVTRVAHFLGAGQVIGVDLVPERLQRAREHGVHVIDLNAVDNVAAVIRRLTDGRGADAVVEAVGMEAHGSLTGKAAQALVAALPGRVVSRLMRTAGLDRLAALNTAIDAVRRGGTISLAGVYGGMTDPLPMLKLFDKQIQLRMGQANVRRWTDELFPVVTAPADPLGLESFATHHLPIQEAPAAYEMFQRKQEGAVKILLRPNER